MRILLNGEPREVAATQLSAALAELGYGEEKIATAVNEAFVPGPAREDFALGEGDRLEVVAPRQGG